MKVCILSDVYPPRHVGGPGIIASEHAKILERDGNQVVVVTVVDQQEQAGVTEEGAVRVYRIYTKLNIRFRAYWMLFNPQTVFTVYSILKKEQPAIVHAHNLHIGLSLFCLTIAKHFGARVFLSAHDVMLVHYGKLTGFMDPADPCSARPNYRVSEWKRFRYARLRYNPLRQPLIRLMLRSVDKILAVSGAVRDVLYDNGITNVSVLWNGIFTKRWEIDETEKVAARERYHLPNSFILFGGRLSKEKGGEELLRAFSLLPASHDARLVLFGAPDSQLNHLLSMASELGVGDRVQSIGLIPRDELPAIFASASIVVVPSTCFDSFPTVVLEGMASAKPVVATCFGGGREAVVDGETGYIVNPFDTTAFKNTLQKLIDDPALAQRMGEAGKARLSKIFSLTAFGERLKEAYGL